MSGDHPILRRPTVLLIAGACALLAIISGARLSTDVRIHPNADLYTHLSVARHLVQGDGFLNDMVYPISLAFPFARELPQPLIQRTPGYPLLLVPVVALAGNDPARAVYLAIRLQLMLLGLLVFVGAVGLLSDERASVLPAWLLTLAAGPLLPVAIGRAEIEIVAALVLLLIWLRLRPTLVNLPCTTSGTGARSAALTGLLVGIFSLLRGELFWLPLFWLILVARRKSRSRLYVTLAVGMMIVLPWLIRNILLTGNPFFSIQAYAEHLKGVAEWPGYSIYQSIQPESFIESFIRRPLTVLHKTGAGLKYFFLHPTHWLAGPLWLLAAGTAFSSWRPGNRMLTLTLAASVGLMMFTYAPFSAEDRHLLIIYPVLTLEIWRGVAAVLRRCSEHLPEILPMILPTVIAALILAFAPAHIEAYRQLDEDSEVIAENLGVMLETLSLQAKGPIFTDSAELIWYGKRSGVWLTRDSRIGSVVKKLVPALETAPTFFGSNPSSGSADNRENKATQQAERQDHSD